MSARLSACQREAKLPDRHHMRAAPFPDLLLCFLDANAGCRCELGRAEQLRCPTEPGGQRWMWEAAIRPVSSSSPQTALFIVSDTVLSVCLPFIVFYFKMCLSSAFAVGFRCVLPPPCAQLQTSRRSHGSTPPSGCVHSPAPPSALLRPPKPHPSRGFGGAPLLP